MAVGSPERSGRGTLVGQPRGSQTHGLERLGRTRQRVALQDLTPVPLTPGLRTRRRGCDRIIPTSRARCRSSATPAVFGCTTSTQGGRPDLRDAFGRGWMFQPDTAGFSPLHFSDRFAASRPRSQGEPGQRLIELQLQRRVRLPRARENLLGATGEPQRLVEEASVLEGERKVQAGVGAGARL